MDVNIVNKRFFQTQSFFFGIVHFLFEIYLQTCSIDEEFNKKQNKNTI